MSQNILMLPQRENQVSKMIKHITYRYTEAVLSPPQAAVFLMIPVSKLSSQRGHAWGRRRPVLSHSTQTPFPTVHRQPYAAASFHLPGCSKHISDEANAKCLSL